MKVSSNRISDIRAFMLDYLKELYPAEEINSMFFILMERFCGMSRTQVHAGLRETINESELLLVYDAIKELGTGKPIQYVTGRAWFCGMEFRVDKDVLIPRPETEELVYLIINENKEHKGLKILDVGSGTGCIGISLVKNLEDAELWSMEASHNAATMTNANGLHLNVHARGCWRNIFNENCLNEFPAFDIIVSNPPYVMESEKSLIHKNVLDYEPHLALFVPNNDPLIIYKAIFHQALKNNSKARIYLEINETKGKEMTLLAQEFGFSDICIYKDINGKDRFCVINSHVPI